MTEKVTLSSLAVGEGMTVSYIGGEEAMRQRLYDIGVVENTYIRCVMISPLGDPKAYVIRGAVIALRGNDACNIVGYKDIGRSPNKEAGQ